MAQSKVLVKTVYPIAGWLRSRVSTSKLGVAQTLTIAKWGPIWNRGQWWVAALCHRNFKLCWNLWLMRPCQGMKLPWRRYSLVHPSQRQCGTWTSLMGEALLHGWQWLSIWIQLNSGLILVLGKVANGLTASSLGGFKKRTGLMTIRTYNLAVFKRLNFVFLTMNKHQ